MFSKVFNGPPGPSVDSLVAGPGSTKGRCFGGGKTVAAVQLVRTVASGATIVGSQVDVGSEGLRFSAPSTLFLRLTIVLTNCFSSRSEGVGPIFVIVLASSRGC